MSKPLYIIGDPKLSSPIKGIASHPLQGLGNVKCVDILTNPGSIRLNNLTAKQSGTTVTGQITWQRVDPVSGFIYAVDDANQVYISIDSGVTWTVIGTGTVGNGAGSGMGLEIWKGYLIVEGSNSASDGRLDAFGPLAGTSPAGTISSTGTAVTGAGTTFTTDAPVGTVIVVQSQYRLVTAVADNTNLTINAAFSPDISGQAYTTYKWKKNFASASTALDLSNTPTYTPIFKSLDDKLYIGNGRYVDKITELTTFDPNSAGTFTYSSRAITLAANYIVRTMRDLGENLMLGTLYAQSTTIADIFPYNRSTLTLALPIRIAENGIRQMYNVGNRLYVVAGLLGKLFLTDTSSAVQIAQIPNYIINLDGASSITLNVYPDAIAYQKSKLLFGIGWGGSGGAQAGVWSYHLTNKVLQFEYLISSGEEGVNNSVFISSLQPIGSNSLTIGVRDVATGSGSTGYWIDKVDSTKRYVSYAGYVDSPLVKVGDALENATAPQIEINLIKPLVTGQGVKLQYRLDLNSSFTTLVTADFATYGGYTSLNVPASVITNAVFLQMRASLTTAASSNLSPELQSVMLKEQANG